MKIAIMCNNSSTVPSARKELISAFRKMNMEVFTCGVLGKYIHSYFSEETSRFLPIEASRSNLNPIVELKSLLSVRKQIKRNSIDYALIYGVKNHISMAIGSKLGGAKRIMCVVNGSGNLFRLSGWKGMVAKFMAFPMLRLAYKCADSICFQNADDRDMFITKRLISDTEKVFITAGSGVNLEEFPKKVLVPQSRFLYLSRITPTKGIKEYLEAANLVKQKYPDAIFDVVGPLDGAFENLEHNYLQHAIDAGWVNYHGPTKEVSEWMGKCRFFIYPSYFEGTPRCVLQALATGRPVITCNAPGCKETVKDGINGFLVPTKDVDTLAKKMIWMIENPNRVNDMAVQSRKYAEEKFDIEKVNNEIIHHLI